MAPSKTKIEDQIALADQSFIKGQSRYPSMTYEEGVSAALRWSLGLESEPPMDDAEQEEQE